MSYKLIEITYLYCKSFTIISQGTSLKLLNAMSQKKRVIELYKTLLALGRDYPQGYDFFRARLKRAFMNNREETSPEKIEEMINRGNAKFIVFSGSDSISSNVYSAALAVIVLHVTLGAFIYKAYSDTGTKPSKQD
ncbi:unnamed protein product [Bemisia tabaci]|uniref:Complex 1 LYR protein domain-containing protein n=1 Tax=Bemisia tabaci TaxID=7038 RepID=A0A9P0EVN9_BEMTA|nr:unnamed protein product [Bemisia tabaci]